ncbi:MAG: non-homologous end-joining DNA ligase, partial [Vicinamibacterales bacterium]
MLKPMLASLEDAPLADPGLVYEPKYDGIRVIAEVRPVGPGASVRLWSRLGNEKTAQFPEVVQALARWGQRLRDPVVLDGEVVALDEGGQPTGFQHLQKRIHVTTGPGAPSDAVAFVAFDILRASGHDLRDRPLHERRTALEHLLAPALRQRQRTLRISEQVAGDGRALYDRAVERGWEGLIAKHVDSQYRSGKRTPDWRKLKIVREQEFVVGGWTEPRRGRPYFGALLLGVYESGRLKYVGHTGTGFDHRELARLMPLLRAREVASPPFAERPKTNERPHWTRPELVAQIKFTEWTADGKLRHPVYLGLRDDKRPEDVRREDAARRRATTRRPGAAPAAGRVPGPASNRARVGSRNRTSAERPQSAIVPSPADIGTLVHTLQDLEDARHDATLDLGDGRHLAITNLHKPFWPALGLTKGDLFRYYVRVAPLLLPAIADRPLVMKRYPNGIAGKPFYQHRATDVPHGIRVEPVPGAAGAPHAGPQSRPHVIGGDLLTLLYTTQLAAISQDPWFSRVGTPDMADYVALDLDPSHGVSFRQVLEVARAIRDV